MTPRSATHTSFAIERDFAASPQAVFRAWADPQAKRRWSDCHPEHTEHYSLDFQVGGFERSRFRFGHDGPPMTNDTLFLDIVPLERIVFAYDIGVDGRRLSVSLVTVALRATPQGTHMDYVEQLTYLDGHEDRAERMRGTAQGLDRLALAVEATGTAQ